MERKCFQFSRVGGADSEARAELLLPPLTHSPHTGSLFVATYPVQAVIQTDNEQRRSPHVKISEKNNVLLWTVIRTDHEDHRI